MVTKTTVLTVIMWVGGIAGGAIVGAVLLLMTDRTVPDQLWNFGLVALGGLIGLLGSVRSTLGAKDVEPTPMMPQPKPGETQNVQVMNEPADPVPVEAADLAAAGVGIATTPQLAGEAWTRAGGGAGMGVGGGVGA